MCKTVSFFLFKVDVQSIEQQVQDKKQQEDYERKRELAFGKKRIG